MARLDRRLYTHEQRDFQAFVFDDVAQADDWHIYQPAGEMRDITIAEITQMITVSPECVFIAAPWDPSTIGVDSQQPPLAHIALVPHHGQADPARNPTPWWFVRWSGYDPGREPQNFCA